MNHGRVQFVSRCCTLNVECASPRLHTLLHITYIHIHGDSKNEPNLASCSFVKHRLILIILGKLHELTFNNSMLIQLSLSRHFCLLYLVFAFCRTMLCKRGLCRHAVSVRPSVCLSVTFVDFSIRKKYIFKFFHRRVLTPFQFFHTKRHDNIPKGTPTGRRMQVR